jgi:secreted trypsin-like serine protease
LEALPEQIEKQIGEKRIVKSTSVPPGKYPSQVSMQHSTFRNHKCAGTIIAAKWVLTNADCFIGYV